MLKKPLWQTVWTQIRLQFASILNSSVMLGNYLQQTASAETCLLHIFLGALRVNVHQNAGRQKIMHVNACYYLITRNSQKETAYLDQPWRKRSTSQRRYYASRLESGIQKLIFLFYCQNMCCGFSKEQSQRDESFKHSFEHPKHMLN